MERKDCSLDLIGKQQQTLLEKKAWKSRQTQMPKNTFEKEQTLHGMAGHLEFPPEDKLLSLKDNSASEATGHLLVHWLGKKNSADWEITHTVLSKGWQQKLLVPGGCGSGHKADAHRQSKWVLALPSHSLPLM